MTGGNLDKLTSGELSSPIHSNKTLSDMIFVHDFTGLLTYEPGEAYYVTLVPQGGDSSTADHTGTRWATFSLGWVHIVI